MNSALEKAMRILRNPGVGKDLPTVTEDQREQLQALAQQVDALLDQMCATVPDLDLGDIIHELSAVGRDLENIITNRVALETEAERQQRRAAGWLTREEAQAAREEQEHIACLHAEYNATRFNYLDR